MLLHLVTCRRPGTSKRAHRLRRLQAEPRRIRPLRLALLAPKEKRAGIKRPSDNLPTLTADRALSNVKLVLHDATTPNDPAQRPGPRGRTIATGTRWPGSLQHG